MSGIVNTGYQVGSALGLAAMTAVAASYGADRLGDVPALTEGYSAAFIGAGAIAAAGAVVTAITLRTVTNRQENTIETEPVHVR